MMRTGGGLRGPLAIFRMNFVGGLQYRAAAVAGIVTQLGFGFMEISLFAAFYRSDPGSFPMKFTHLAAYVWLQQATLGLMMPWYTDVDILESITSGKVAYELCRPLGLYGLWFSQDGAKRLSKTVLRCFPILMIALFMPGPYRLVFDAPLWTLLVFLLSLALGALLVIVFDMFVYIGTIYTMSSQGLRIFYSSLSELLAGSILPLPFLPDGLRRVLELQPFASMQNAPFRIFSGDISGTYMLWTVLLQMFWLLLFLWLSTSMMNRALRRVTVQGG